MQLFAIIAKQDDGVSSLKNEYVKEFLNLQISTDLVSEYFNLYLSFVDDPQRGQNDDEGEVKLTSVTDSVRILGICKKINKTLQQNQKVIVFVRLLEFIRSDNSFTRQRVEIIQTVAKVFRIDRSEIESIEQFVQFGEGESPRTFGNLLVIGDSSESDPEANLFLRSENLHGHVYILRVESVNLYFVRYSGDTPVVLNNKPMSPKRIYLLAPGSVIKPSLGKTIFYSDVKTRYLADQAQNSLTFSATGLQFNFKSGRVGLHPMSVHQKSGTLVGIMGASGAGKTTLLSILSGQQKPTTGSVTINGIDLYNGKGALEGIIGMVPQDDLLFEDLTVFENLYYNTKLCFRNLPRQEAGQRVDTVLSDLGLLEIKHLKVGSPLSKVISGGQRKRLNIALELIREPSVLFLDEPTSGLSSRDSENVMDLLRELALKGKLVFVVIHQPSSTIFKLFDTLLVLDTGGYLIYEGNPVEAVSYFKRIDHQINHELGECQTCGNVNPETIFDIIESKIVDEYGNTTDERKVSPAEWYDLRLKERPTPTAHEPATEAAGTPRQAEEEALSAHRSDKPGRLMQWLVFATRDLKTKLANRQYLFINLTEAPALAFFLSFLMRYTEGESAEYYFKANENVPAFIFISVIVSTFLGLMVSSEEIIRDRKILKREQFLNLSKLSYLLSKVAILFGISAIQSFLFIAVANTILEIQGQFFTYWFALFTVSACANVLGLNISASFNSVVTIYILIPLIIIPQMVLSGAMFRFDRLNKAIGGGIAVPVIAHLMPARWAYEAVMVRQFRQNKYQELFFDLDREISHYDFRLAHLLPALRSRVNDLYEISANPERKSNDTLRARVNEHLNFIYNQLKDELVSDPSLFNIKGVSRQEIGRLNDQSAALTLTKVLNQVEERYIAKFNEAYNKKEEILLTLGNDPQKAALLKEYERNFTNDAIGEQVCNKFSFSPKTMVEGKIVQLSDPIFQSGEFTRFNGFGAPFFASEKGAAGQTIGTYWFNMAILWIMTIGLFVLLQFNLLGKILNALINIKSQNK